MARPVSTRKSPEVSEQDDFLTSDHLLKHCDNPNMAKHAVLMRRCNATLRKHKAAVDRAIRLLGNHNDAWFGGDREELRSRLFSAPAHREHIDYKTAGISEEDFACLSVLKNFALTDYRPTFATFLNRALDDTATIPMSPAERDRFNALRALETVIMAGHVKMVYRIRNRLCLSQRHLGMVDGQDLVAVGFLAVRDAIYGYRRKEVKFVTYVYHAIFRRMLREIASGNDVRKVSKNKFKLLAAYYKAILVNPEDDSFESVVFRTRIAEPGDGADKPTDRPLTGAEVDDLKAIFTRFVRDNELLMDTDRGGRGGRGIESIRDPHPGVDFGAIEFQEVVAKACLTDHERNLVELAVHNPYPGFRTDYARSQDVTRAWASQCLLNAQKKIARVLEGINRRAGVA